MEILNWYNNLMDNYYSLTVGVLLSFVAIYYWGKFEEKWKMENNYGTVKKIIKGIGIALIAIFGLPGILLFFGSWN